MTIDRDLKCPKFEIRLWTEHQAESGEKKDYSGVITHIQTGKTAHFRGAGALLKFIEESAGINHRLDE